ncbi:MAG: hypothetical protein LBV53_02940 [Mycoplasmataceae bacterium]|nr:hypothetical protein [Mycoplasmataceae bacterium]
MKYKKNTFRFKLYDIVFVNKYSKKGQFVMNKTNELKREDAYLCMYMSEITLNDMFAMFCFECFLLMIDTNEEWTQEKENKIYEMYERQLYTGFAASSIHIIDNNIKEGWIEIKLVTF